MDDLAFLEEAERSGDIDALRERIVAHLALGDAADRFIASMLDPEGSTTCKLEIKNRTRGNRKQVADARPRRQRLRQLWDSLGDEKDSFVTLAVKQEGITRQRADELRQQFTSDPLGLW